jgi:Cdc6-like AAA superfamily ATPase
MEEVCASFDGFLEEGWREQGVRPQEVEKWCALYGHPYFLVRAGKLIKIVDPPEKLGKAIAYAIYDGHAYFYKSAKTVANWTVSSGAAEPRQVMQHEHRQTLPEISEWKSWSMPPQPGHFFAPDLDRVRKELLESGRNPKVALYRGARITSVSYVCTQALDGCKGSCVIRKQIEHREEIEQWLSRSVRQITWNAEALPALTHKVLNELLKSERRSCPAEQRKEILRQQNGRCALCGGIFDDDVEWDHKNPLQQTVRGQETKWQAICASCHVEKTGLEGKQDRTLESTFSLPVWKDYVETPRPPPVVTWLHLWKEGEETLELDVRRCRRNALAISAHDFSVFSPLDSITPSQEGDLGDFSFVTLKVKNKGVASLLPYTGPGWYHRVAVEHMLHYGQITWQDISHSLSSTGRVPPQCLAEPLRQMEEAWGGHEDLAKLSVNQMIGLWATDATQVYHVKTSKDPVDGLGAWAKRYVEFEGGYVTDYIFASSLLTNTSMRPIHDQIMCTEHTRLAQLLFCLKALKVPPRCLKCIKTDCVVLQGPIKKRKAELESLAELTFGDLPKLRSHQPNFKTSETCVENVETQQFLDSYCSISKHKFSSNSEVFRLGEGKELKGCWTKPWRESKQPGELAILEGSPVTPQVLPVRRPWRDVSKEEALELMQAGKGLLLVGSPGTGKTHWLRNAIASLRQAGKRVEIVAKTHAAVQNIGCEAKTADHWVRKHVRAGGVHCHTLVVEELTQINVQLWADLALCRFKGVSFVCAGDFGQFPPICEHWSGCAVPEGALERSDMLFEMCGGHRLTLTENMRSDARLFEAYTNLGETLEEALAKTRALFPVSKRPARYTLTISHKERMRVNRIRNLQDAQEGILLKAPKETRGGNQPQDMLLWKGLQLIGAGHRCLKGLFYEVEEVTQETVTLTGGLVLTHEQAVQSLRLCYALTYASCQGLTLPGVVRLDTQSQHFTLKHLYVGLSRATAADLVEVC